MRTPIAYYVRWKAAAVAVLMLGVVLFGVWLLLFFKGGFIEQYQARGAWGFAVLGYVGICACALTLFAAIELLNQLVFHDGMAVWIDDGNIVMVHKWLLSAKCNDVERVFYGRSEQSGKKGILLQSRDGDEKRISTSALREPEYVVVERLVAEIRQMTGRHVKERMV